MRRLLFPIASFLFWRVAPSSAFAPAGRAPSFGSATSAATPRASSAASPVLRALAPDEAAALASTTFALAQGALSAATSLSAPASESAAAGLLSSDSIKAAFSVATFFPQLPWLFLILLPNSGVTKKLLGGYEIVTICCLVHFFIVACSIAQPDGTAPIAEFADVFDPAGDPQKAMVGMMQYPNFVSEEWSHVLTWDLFVGRWIWLDGLKRGVFTPHSVLLCNLIGPPGLLLHWLTCLVTGKGGWPENEATSLEGEEE